MPANLPPLYYEAERKFRRAKTIPERVAGLQEMMSTTPKHKGTDHLRADQRARMARLMADLEKPSSTGSSQPEPFALRKEGAGQAMLVGLPNGGKSQLLANLTGASAKVAGYPFTTKFPQPGMLRFQNVLVQLVDTPAVNDRDMQTRLFSLLRNTDLLIIVIDLLTDAVQQMSEVMEELRDWGYLLLGREDSVDPEDHSVQKRALLVGNKADGSGALDQLQSLQDHHGSRFPIVMTSSLEGVGMDDLRESVFAALDNVRVYTKAPGGEPDYNAPIVLARGSRVEDAAQALHREWLRRLNYAVLWGSGKYEGQRVGREYVLADGDVLEFHGKR